jgi:hypothetical protein
MLKHNLPGITDLRGWQGSPASVPFLGGCGGTMPKRLKSLELHCPACSWRQLCGPQGVAAWLRKVHKIRPGRLPEPEILYALLDGVVGQLTCPKCGAVGLSASPAAEDLAGWPEPRRCVSCAKPIPPERLEAIPNVTRCAACQQEAEQGRVKPELDYCPRCGAPMEVRVAQSGGRTRYVMACTATPPCDL